MMHKCTQKKEPSSAVDDTKTDVQDTKTNDAPAKVARLCQCARVRWVFGFFTYKG